MSKMPVVVMLSIRMAGLPAIDTPDENDYCRAVGGPCKTIGGRCLVRTIDGCR
ncbi:MULTISPECIES: hypothetical protein [Burkholderia]|uniref:hypothetical protein n=1 Tax=Burkholderia TaxID=32008 RepID=UPI001363AA97|nr:MULTISPECIES: hypothetical protein [Burkholderia]